MQDVINMFCDVNEEKSNQLFIFFDDYSVSERVYTYDEAIKLQEVLSNQGFFVDETIAQAISQLNKKGYTTSYCCSGHLLKDRQPVLVKEKKNILDFLPERKKHLIPKNGYIKVEEDEKNILFLYEGAYSQSYITFAEEVKIDSIPEGFYLDLDNSNTTIRSNADCCIDDNGTRFISDDEARERLRHISENLQSWVNTLPYKKIIPIQKKH